MADATRPPASERTQALVRRLLEDAAPVRPLWKPSARLGLWLAGVALIAVAVGLSGVRPDLGAMLADPLYLLDIALLAAAGVLVAARAFGEAVPGYEARARGVAVGLVLVVFGLWTLQPMHAEVAMGAFAAIGIGCAMKAATLAALPWAALLVALRRGAPLAPGRAGALAGAAAFLGAALLMRIACPMDERLHLLVWHGLPVVAGAAVSAAIGWAWLGGWRRSAVR